MSESGQTRKISDWAYRVCFAPKERTWSGHSGLAAWGHQRTHGPQQSVARLPRPPGCV